MTLAFLGYQPEQAIDQIAEAAMGFEAKPLVRLLAERSGPRSHLGAIDSESGKTVALQSEVERRRLVGARFYEDPGAHSGPISRWPGCARSGGR